MVVDFSDVSVCIEAASKASLWTVPCLSILGRKLHRPQNNGCQFLMISISCKFYFFFRKIFLDMNFLLSEKPSFQMS